MQQYLLGALPSLCLALLLAGLVFLLGTRRYGKHSANGNSHAEMKLVRSSTERDGPEANQSPSGDQSSFVAGTEKYYQGTNGLYCCEARRDQQHNVPEAAGINSVSSETCNKGSTIAAASSASSSASALAVAQQVAKRSTDGSMGALSGKNVSGACTPLHPGVHLLREHSPLLGGSRRTSLDTQRTTDTSTSAFDIARAIIGQVG